MAEEGGAARPAKAPGGVPPQAVRWGFRLLAGREVMDHELPLFQALPDITGLRRTLANTHEFHAFFGSLVSGHQAWSMPLFLLRPPAVEGLEWKFEPPNLEHPVCQFCTHAQFADPVFQEIVGAMGLRAAPSRAQWEQAWIVSVLATEGLVAPGRTGLGLACGRERIASLFASRAVQVTCTDEQEREGRALEHRRIELFYPEIIPIAHFDQLVRFVRLDPRDVGRVDPPSFDFCWSIGAPDTLGSTAATIDFLEASLAPLKPGGIAAHAFAFNLTSNGRTWQKKGGVLMRRRDIEELAERLAKNGHQLLPLNTHPGLDPEDEQVEGSLAGAPGLRQRRGMMVTTSFGLAIRKAR